MIDALARSFEAAADPAMAIAFKTALILALTGVVVAALARRTSAAARHAAWFVAVVATLALPVLAAIVPDWRVLPVWFDGDGPAAGTVAITTMESPLSMPIDASAPSAARAPSGGTGSVAPLGIGGWLVVVWLAGSLLCGAALIVGRFGLARLLRAAQPIRDVPTLDRLRETAERLGRTRPICLMRTPCRSGPLVWSAWLSRESYILVPEEAEDWSADRWRAVLLHELAHLRRGDGVSRLAARIACCVYWFNPLVWYAARRMQTEQELACDDAVISAGHDPADYADHLLAVVVAARRPAPAMGMARAAGIESRVRHILDPRGRRGGGRRALVIASIAALLIVPLVAAIALAQPTPRTTGDRETTRPQAVTAARADGDESTRPEGRPGEQNVGELMERALDHYNAREYDRTLEVLEQVLRLDPQNSIAIEIKESTQERIERRRAEGADRYQILTYDISDLLRDVHFNAQPGFEHKGPPIPLDVLRQQIGDLIRDTVAPDTWRQRGGTRASLSFHDDETIVVVQTAQNHRDIAALLDLLRSTRSIGIEIDARLLTIAAADAEALAENWSQSDGPGPGPRYRIAYTDDRSLEKLNDAIAGGRGELVIEPHLRLPNGQASRVRQGREVNYIADYEIERQPDGDDAYVPNYQTANEGIDILIEGTASADREYVTLTLTAEFSAITRVRSIPVELPRPLPRIEGERTVIAPPRTPDGQERPHLVRINSLDTETTRYRTTVTTPVHGWMLLQLPQAPRLPEGSVYLLAVRAKIVDRAPEQ